MPTVPRTARFYIDLAVTILMVVATGLVIYNNVPRSPNPPPPTPTTTPPREPIPVPSEPIDIADSARTAPGPRAVIMEFSDPECPHCVRYARQIAPELRREYGDRVRFVYRHLVPETARPLAMQAAAAMECARRQRRFWDMHELVFTDANHDRTTLAGHAASLGLDRDRFDACFSGDARDVVRRDIGLAVDLGMTGTPSFLFGVLEGDFTVRVTETMRGAPPIEAFREVLNRLLTTESLPQRPK